MTNKKHTYDVIIVGLGSMGSSTLYHLSTRGFKVLGVDRYQVPHDKGSHTGQSRLIRKAYYEHPDYVPLLFRAYENWNEIEEVSGTSLYYETGILYMGRANHPIISGMRYSAGKYDIPIEDLSSNEAFRRHTQFNIPSDYDILIEKEAGFVTPEKAIEVCIQLSQKNGAHIISGEAVKEWELINQVIHVHTLTQTYTTRKLVLATGAYTPALSTFLKPKLKVTKQWLAWYLPEEPETFTLGNFPCWCVAHEEDEGIYYGFPMLDQKQHPGPKGIKIAHHSPGKETNPEEDRESSTEKEQEKLTQFLTTYLPGKIATITALRSCYYTYSPDEHFIIDFVPESDNKILIAAGFSGHGFKFASVIGEALADLAIKGKTDLPIHFLGLDRFKK